MADEIVDYIALGEKIRQRRLKSKLSQETVSEKIDLSQGFYGHIERGERKLSVESLVKIANCLNLSLDFLLLESKSRNIDVRLQAEFDNIFRGKTPDQAEHLLSIFKVLAEGVEKLKP